MPRKNRDLLKESHDVFTTAHDTFMEKASFYLPDPAADRIRQMMVSVDRDILLADTKREATDMKDLENIMMQVGIKALSMVLAIRGLSVGDLND